MFGDEGDDCVAVVRFVELGLAERVDQHEACVGGDATWRLEGAERLQHAPDQRPRRVLDAVPDTQQILDMRFWKINMKLLWGPEGLM